MAAVGFVSVFVNMIFGKTCSFLASICQPSVFVVLLDYFRTSNGLVTSSKQSTCSLGDIWGEGV